MKNFKLISAFAALSMLFASCNGNIDPENNGGGDNMAPVVQGEKITSIYKQKRVAMQFTSVGCVYCPNLAASIKSVHEKQPGMIIPVAFHLNYGDVDPMALPECEKFYKRVAFEDEQAISLPMLALNFRKGSQKIVDQEAKIMDEMEYQVEEYPTSSGVAINTVYDQSSRKLEVTARFVSEVTQSAKYHIILVEDGVEYAQTGAETSEYTHNNVFRYISSDNLKGTDLNLGKPLTPGMEYQVTKTITLKNSWNPAAMRVVAVMLTPDDAAGKNFGCNNANECAVGSSVDFQLVADGPAVESRFKRNVCVMEFTGQWCPICPEGATLLQYLVNKMYQNQMHVLAFHHDDDFSIPVEKKLTEKFGLTDYPYYLTDMREGGVLLGDGCMNSIENSLYKSLTHSAVAVSSKINDGICKVNARVFSEKRMEYAMAAYVVEDKITAWQTVEGPSRDEDYLHRHVVRMMLSSSFAGDDLGVLAAEQEAEHSYEFAVDPAWNLENTTVVVLAIDKNGQVNNVAECALDGGCVEYETKK